ncbi:DUF4743 domain-containing protein [Kerstersia sp.]|uniref:NUDIX hydrolase n=1 Tax=Kerstersia sp. TaxID=1930783 RepID=UPI003F939ABB
MPIALPSLARLQSHAQRLHAGITQPPPAGAMPLYIAGQRCGWIVPAAMAALQTAGLAAEADGVWHIGMPLAPHSAALADVCDAVALALRDAGCLHGWRDEALDIYSVAPDSPPLGRIERTATRPLGLRTLAVHLNGWTPDGRIWLARRSLTKNTDPGMWDTLVGGLASSGESLDLALVRESAEEAGLTPDDLAGRTPLRTVTQIHHHLPEGYQVEDVLLSRCVLAEHVQPRNQDGEVMEIRAVAPLEIMDMLEAGLITQEAAIVLLDDMQQQAQQAG